MAWMRVSNAVVCVLRTTQQGCSALLAVPRSIIAQSCHQDIPRYTSHSILYTLRYSEHIITLLPGSCTVPSSALFQQLYQNSALGADIVLVHVLQSLVWWEGLLISPVVVWVVDGIVALVVWLSLLQCMLHPNTFIWLRCLLAVLCGL